ncbi:hypothetical protein CRG98_009111 [Punica granatum]|uniref:Uncharacterized protein n=1 Tax=Punica granatum TaxID=22663 RepID=A0A2I0KRY8_PUNGR|nr:hypothetical protein CRG98_009111 [Punica granatum]
METMSPVQVKDVLEDSSPPLEGRKTGLALRSSMATATEQQREEAVTKNKAGTECAADLGWVLFELARGIRGELREKDPQMDTRKYDTFTHYYSNKVALGEAESPAEDATPTFHLPSLRRRGIDTAPAA